MDAEALACSDASFDVAINSLGAMYYPDPDKAFREMYRIIKPGGRAVALLWGRRSTCGWAEIFPFVDRRVESDVCPLFSSLALVRRYSTHSRPLDFMMSAPIDLTCTCATNPIKRRSVRS